MRTLLILSVLAVSGCDRTDAGNTYYLYRSPVIGPAGERIHIATFDAKEGRAYNEENCMIVRGLMERQPGVTVGYWCTQLAP